MDYSDKIQGAYDKVAAKGGAIVFKQAAEAPPTDADKPWEGNSENPVDFAHIGVLLPLGAQVKNATSNHRILIPAKGLPFQITMEQEFTDLAGRTYAITAISVLAPDPTQVILYDCECALWPAA